MPSNPSPRRTRRLDAACLVIAACVTSGWPGVHAAPAEKSGRPALENRIEPLQPNESLRVAAESNRVRVKVDTSGAPLFRIVGRTPLRSTLGIQVLSVQGETLY